MSFCAHGLDNVTSGAALPVRASVTEVTFGSMICEVQFVTNAPQVTGNVSGVAVF
jgi:hypothetical protein